MRAQRQDRPVSGRFGHLTELTANRYLAGELGEDARAALRAHLCGCRPCQHYLDRLRQFDGGCQLPPLRLVQTGGHERVAHGTGSWTRLDMAPTWLATVSRGRSFAQGTLNDAPAYPALRLRAHHSLLAGAAALALVLLVGIERPAPLPDRRSFVAATGGVRLKSAGFSLAAWAKSAAGVRPIESGDAIHPGESLGFQLFSHRAGHLVIFGSDELGNTYLCYPQHLGGRSTYLEAAPAGIELRQAVRFDDVLGTETIVALLCPEPVDYTMVSERVAHGARLDDVVGRIAGDCL
jgi:hypothetical protein